MNFLRQLSAYFKGHFFPSEENRFRPNSLSRDALMAAVALTCVIEGFLVTSLFIQTRPGSFAAAVIESAIVSLTNEQRLAYGDASLRVDPTLTRAAQAKADDMVARGYFAHEGPTGEQPWVWFSAAGYDYAYAGENLATRFYESSDVVAAWMNSPGHRANILKGVYQDMGIGISQGMYQGQQVTFVVQFFGTTRKALGMAQSTGAGVALGASTLDTTSAETPEAPPSAPPTLQIETGAPSTEEALAAVQSEEITPAAAPVVESQAISTVPRPSVSSSIARFLASPRTIALFLLGSIVAFLLIALTLAIVIRIRVQPVDLLINGSVVAVFTLTVLFLNMYFLTGADISPGAAAVSEVFSKSTP